MLIRALEAAMGCVLLAWAYAILENIWTYNDSGTVAYVVYAAIPGLAGLGLLYLAARRR